MTFDMNFGLFYWPTTPTLRPLNKDNPSVIISSLNTKIFVSAGESFIEFTYKYICIYIYIYIYIYK